MSEQVHAEPRTSEQLIEQSLELPKLKERLFGKLIEKKDELLTLEKAAVCGAVMQQSVEDGLEIASLYGLDPAGLMLTFLPERFVLSHQELTEKIAGGLQHEIDTLSGLDAKTREAMENFTQALTTSRMAPREIIHGAGWALLLQSPVGKELLADIRAYYSQVLGARASDPKKPVLKESKIEPEPGRKGGVQIAEEHLRRYEHALAGDYLSGEIYKIAIGSPYMRAIMSSKGKELDIYEQYGQPYPQYKTPADFCHAVLAGNVFIPEMLADYTSTDANMFFSPLMSMEDTHVLLGITRVDMNDPKNKKALEAARYKISAPVAAAGEKSAAKYLEAEMKDLARRYGCNLDRLGIDINTGLVWVDDPMDLEAKEQPFNWDLDTFETFEAHLGTKNATVKKIYRFDETTVVIYERKGKEIILSLPDKHESQPYDYIEPIGKTKEGMVAVGKRQKTDDYIILINGVEAQSYAGYVLSSPSSAIVADGKLAFVGTREENGVQLSILYIEGEGERNLSIAYSNLRNLRHANGTYYCIAYDKITGNAVVIDNNGNHKEEYSHIKQMEIFAGNRALTAMSTGEFKAVYDGKELVSCHGNIELLPPHPAMPGPIFIINDADKNDNYFLFPDGQRSSNYNDIRLSKSIPNDEDWVVTCTNNGRRWYSLRQRKELKVGTTVLPCSPQMMDGEPIYQYAVLPGEKAQLHKYPDVPLMRRCSGLNFLIGQKEVTVAEIDNGILKVHRKKRQNEVADDEWTALFSDPEFMRKEKLFQLLYLVRSDERHEAKLQEIRAYFAQQYKPATWKDELRSLVSGSPPVTAGLNEALRKHPEAFLDTIAAVPDRTDPAFVNRIIETLFPELTRIKAEQSRKNEKSLGDRLRQLWQGKEQRANPLLTRDKYVLEGGDPTAKAGPELFRFRELPPGMIATAYLGAYDASANVWSPLRVPVTPHLEEPVREYTAEIPVQKGVSEIRLPLAAGGRIIPERVKGRRFGVEKPLESNTDMTGLSTAKITGKPETILYSQQVSDTPAVPGDISQSAYDAWKKRLVKNGGESLLKPVGRVGPEERQFLHSLEELSPKEKLIAIQRYVQTIGYYDFDNGKTLETKKGADATANFAMMRERLAAIQKEPGSSAALAKKRYAGVCNDFAILSTSLLREAGFVSGIVTGFNPDGKTVTGADAHAASFVLWPNEHGDGQQLIVVDATPDGVTREETMALSKIKLPNLEETAKFREQTVSKMLEDAENKLKGIEKLDASHIQKLTNGDLERAVNTILRYDVRRSHVEVLRDVLNTAAYSPAALTRIDMRDPEARAGLLSWMNVAIQTRRNELLALQDEAGKPAGTLLVHLMSEFEDRFAKNAPDENRRHVFDLLQTAVDTARDYLDPKEYRAATAVITYLRARKMKK